MADRSTKTELAPVAKLLEELDICTMTTHAESPNGTWINVEGEATIVRDEPERKREMWQKDLERWFTNGADEPEVVLIKVSARHIDAWADEDEHSFDVS